MATARPMARTRTAAAAPKQSSGYRGAEGRARMAVEEERAQARKEAATQNANMPFRFFCPVGETREVVVIDDAPDWFRYEHNLKNNRSGKWDIFCACIAEHANCPVDKVAERPAYYALYLTVIDLTPYVNKDDVEVPWSKKLLVVKFQQQKKFTRLFEREGTLRGMVLAMTRDGDKDASIGNDIEFVEFMSEEDLATYETTIEYTKDNKKMTREVIGHEAFDYDELFPMPTEQQLRALVGGRPEPGSRDEEESAGRTSRRAPARDFDAPARPARSRPARGEETIDPDDLPDAGEEAEAPPPRRGAAAPARRAAAPAPAAAPARRTRAAAPPPEEEVYEDEPEEEAPPPRRAAPAVARRAAPAPAAAPARRAAPPQRAARPDPEADQEEDPPQRSGGSLAERRRALRGR